ncbi:unnamed protein product [Sphenostylis stenocarpa]|uniref:Uncharacterized protein n=1 Tax=Sphenostylis stenocarpa TaxID=92480 RepID=A0AA86S2K4_9FABA|nr:unnamed protein product [Sphenostylis stenocarpa]
MMFDYILDQLEHSLVRWMMLSIYLFKRIPSICHREVWGVTAFMNTICLVQGVLPLMHADDFRQDRYGVVSSGLGGYSDDMTLAAISGKSLSKLSTSYPAQDMQKTFACNGSRVKIGNAPSNEMEPNVTKPLRVYSRKRVVIEVSETFVKLNLEQWCLVEKGIAL